MSVRIGVLALQGSFSEHVDMLKKMGVDQTEVRVADDLVGCDGLIFPGGESTAMALIGEKCGIFPALREWVQRCINWLIRIKVLFLEMSQQCAIALLHPFYSIELASEHNPGLRMLLMSIFLRTVGGPCGVPALG